MMAIFVHISGKLTVQPVVLLIKVFILKKLTVKYTLIWVSKIFIKIFLEVNKNHR